MKRTTHFLSHLFLLLLTISNATSIEQPQLLRSKSINTKNIDSSSIRFKSTISLGESGAAAEVAVAADASGAAAALDASGPVEEASASGAADEGTGAEDGSGASDASGAETTTPAPVPQTEAEVACLDEAKVRCHHDFRERCPALSRTKHCCRHWYSYLGGCYAWSLNWCMGPPKKAGIPCAEAPMEPSAAPEAVPVDPEDAEAEEEAAASGPAAEAAVVAVDAEAEAEAGF